MKIPRYPPKMSFSARFTNDGIISCQIVPLERLRKYPARFSRKRSSSAVRSRSCSLCLFLSRSTRPVIRFSLLRRDRAYYCRVRIKSTIPERPPRPPSLFPRSTATPPPDRFPNTRYVGLRTDTQLILGPSRFATDGKFRKDEEGGGREGGSGKPAPSVFNKHSAKAAVSLERRLGGGGGRICLPFPSAPPPSRSALADCLFTPYFPREGIGVRARVKNFHSISAGNPIRRR